MQWNLEVFIIIYINALENLKSQKNTMCFRNCFLQNVTVLCKLNSLLKCQMCKALLTLFFETKTAANLFEHLG